MNEAKESVIEKITAVQEEIKAINAKTAHTRLRPVEYRCLMARKKELGFEIQRLQLEMQEIKRQRQEDLAMAFLETTIKMFDPQDISEIWDRLYVDYPHLKDERKWLK